MHSVYSWVSSVLDVQLNRLQISTIRAISHSKRAQSRNSQSASETQTRTNVRKQRVYISPNELVEMANNMNHMLARFWCFKEAGFCGFWPLLLLIHRRFAEAKLCRFLLRIYSLISILSSFNIFPPQCDRFYINGSTEYFFQSNCWQELSRHR